ncbi:MAG: nucleotidyltransferase family protein [Syntrophorhabdales bacterium]|jgi:molybdenum cofactor cytidylyltransferase
MVRISTVILAAGASRRLGFNKLCVRVNGEAVIRRTVRLFVEAVPGEIAVVTGFERERVEQELAGLPVTLFHNERPEDGMSSSIRAALPVIGRSDLVLFHLGDKPFVEPRDIDRVMRAYGADGPSIIVAVHKGVKGHPVLVDMRRHLEEVGAIEGQGGLRDVIAGAKGYVRFVEGTEGCILDMDTEEDIAFLRRRGYTIEKG